MPAHIEVYYNGDETAEFWIEKPVLRVGSNESCDVLIRSSLVASHAATIQYRDGGYVVHNRTESPLMLAERTIAPGASESWQDRETLLVAPDVSVCLVIDGSAAPTRQARDNTVLKAYQQKREIERAEQQAIEEQKSDEQQAAGEAKQEKASLDPQLLVGGVCFVLALLMLGGIGFMLLKPPAAQSGDPLATPPNIPAELLKYKSEMPSDLVIYLQEAQQAVQRGDATLARRRLHRLRAELARQTTERGELTINRNGQMFDYGPSLTRYINYYLAQVEER
ncbi:MAG: FHA domain-containing protein [Pirellulaceae bacterium]